MPPKKVTTHVRLALNSTARAAYFIPWYCSCDSTAPRCTVLQALSFEFVAIPKIVTKTPNGHAVLHVLQQEPLTVADEMPTIQGERVRCKDGTA